MDTWLIGCVVMMWSPWLEIPTKRQFVVQNCFFLGCLLLYRSYVLLCKRGITPPRYYLLKVSIQNIKIALRNFTYNQGLRNGGYCIANSASYENGTSHQCLKIQKCNGAGTFCQIHSKLTVLTLASTPDGKAPS